MTLCAVLLATAYAPGPQPEMVIRLPDNTTLVALSTRGSTAFRVRVLPKGTGAPIDYLTTEDVQRVDRKATSLIKIFEAMDGDGGGVLSESEIKMFTQHELGPEDRDGNQVELYPRDARLYTSEVILESDNSGTEDCESVSPELVELYQNVSAEARAKLLLSLPFAFRRRMAGHVNSHDVEEERVNEELTQRLFSCSDDQAVSQLGAGIVSKTLKEIVSQTALQQTMKGLISAGVVKSAVYSYNKIGKRLRLPLPCQDAEGAYHEPPPQARHAGLGPRRRPQPPPNGCGSGVVVVVGG